MDKDKRIKELENTLADLINHCLSIEEEGEMVAAAMETLNSPVEIFKFMED